MESFEAPNEGWLHWTVKTEPAPYQCYAGGFRARHSPHISTRSTVLPLPTTAFLDKWLSMALAS